MRYLRVALLMICAQTGGVSGQDEVRTLGIVEDGESQYFERIRDRVLEELEVLCKGKYKLETKRYSGSYSADRIEENLWEAMKECDVVYAAGTIATERASRFDEAKRNLNLTGDDRTKPVMGGALQFTERGERMSKELTSAIPNYTFVTSPRRVAADLTLLKELTEASSVHALVDAVLLPEILPEAEKTRANIEAKLGMSVEFVGSGETVAETLRAIPAGVKNLYVAIQPRLDDDERKALYAALAKRGVRTVSMHGGGDVKRGAMAGLAPDNGDVVARRMALNLHQLLQGGGTDRLVVSLPVADRLMINLQTGDAAGWAPTYDTVLKAEVLNDFRSRPGKPLTLNQAMGRAAMSNAEVLAERESVTIARRDADLLQSRLLPSVGLGMQHGGTKFSDRINSMTTPERAHQGTFGLELRQVLFNDELWSNLRAQRISAAASALDAESRRLDATEAAAVAFFDYLTAQALHRIEKENLELTENNLEMARLRVEIEAAIPSEVFRWEQGRARSRAALFQRDAARENARVELNRVMGEPRDRVWSIEDIVVGDDEFFFLGDDLKRLIKNAREFRIFGKFVQNAAVVRSPELLSFRAALEAQGIVLGQLKRQYILPEISGSASIDRVVSGSSSAQSDGQNEATVGIVFSLPLFEGGGRREEIRRQEAVIRQIEAQREGALQRIEQRVMVAFYGISSSHPTVRLSREGLVAAELNYESVNERYVRNAVTQLDILDAQSTLLQQRQEAAVAVYDYLKDVHALQRALAWFEYNKTAEQKREFVRQLGSYLEGGGVDGGDDPAEAGGERVEEAGRGWFPWFRKNGKW